MTQEMILFLELFLVQELLQSWLWNFTLSGSNTYSGSTTISAGTIAISSSANIGATPGTVDADNIIFNGGTLNTTGTFSLEPIKVLL